MGWKKFKEHFEIEHIVQITSKGLCIGSGYAHDLGVIDLNTGMIIKKPGVFGNFIKEYYPKLNEATPAEILALLKAPDSFEKSIPVYSYNEEFEVVQRLAENLGWPNVTHCGSIMYENTYFLTYDEAFDKALHHLNSEIDWNQEQIQIKEKEMLSLEQELKRLEIKKKNMKREG